MNKHFKTMPLIVLILVFAVGILIRLNRDSSSVQSCPDQWIEDKMPSAESESLNKQYFIVDGERKELDEYDIEWVEANCSLQVERVY